jgi:hypothetical protein
MFAMVSIPVDRHIKKRKGEEKREFGTESAMNLLTFKSRLPQATREGIRKWKEVERGILGELIVQFTSFLSRSSSCS